MNATAALLRRASGSTPAGLTVARAWRLPTLTLLAFSALALLAALRFAALLAHPPTLRVLGVVAAAAACGAALAATRAVPRRLGLATAARVAIIVLAAYLSLRAAGAPARLLWPWRWGSLAEAVSHGLNALDGLWPYRGELAQARLAMMLALPTTLIPAAALAFWPGARRAPARRVGALALLLGLYLTAASNESQVGWRVQGILLLALLCLWGWAWRPRPADYPRAMAWMLVGAIAALAGASAVHARGPLLDYHNWNPFGLAYSPTSFNWNQVYGPLPWSDSTETMVDVASRAPHLWRATTLDRFDGVRFLRSQRTPPNTSGLSGVALNPRWLTRATFTVRGLSSEELLSSGQIFQASIEGLAVPHLDAIAPDGTLSVSGEPAPSGDRYTVISYAPDPSVAELQQAPRAVPAAYAPFTEFDLPASGHASAPVSTASAPGIARIEASPYARVYALARRLDPGALSAYGAVARIEGFLHHGFTYDLDPPRSTYPLVSFLLSERLGYCQQFSGAMTLLLRMDGIPARVAAGFLPGSRNPSSGLYEVSAQDAHAWVEVFFPGIGWVSFDPTPARPRAGSSAARRAAGASPTILRHRATPNPQRPGRRAAASRSSSSGGSSALELAIGLAGALALLLGAAWWAGAARARGALCDDADGAVRELSRALPAVGLDLNPGTTLAELERELELSHGPGASRYVRLLRERRFAGSADPQLPSARDRRLLRRSLCARRGPLARLRVLLALPPGAGRTRRSIAAEMRPDSPGR